MNSPIFVLSGPPASGKSTMAPALLQNYPHGLHIPVDTLRNWVASGKSDPIGSWDDETEHQFRLARQGAAQLAITYADAGFAVAIDDVITPEHFQSHYAPHFEESQPFQVMLLPQVDVARARNAMRRKDENTSSLNDLILNWHNHVSQFDLASLGWHVIDGSGLSVEETVSEILSVLNFPDNKRRIMDS